MNYKNKENTHIKSLDQYNELYKESLESPDSFWGKIANRIDWYKRWNNVSDIDYSKAQIRWFKNGKLNASYNCLDRHIKKGYGGDIALIWESNNPDQHKKYTYKELLDEVSKFSNILKLNNIKKR